MILVRCDFVLFGADTGSGTGKAGQEYLTPYP